MAIAYDPAKDAENIASYGLSFADFDGFDGEPMVLVDDRFEYGELRYRTFGRIGGLGHCLVFTMRGAAMRLISFRRAHDKELQRYGH
ncbi:MAG: BrnT family toxin [Sphingomicrobium sp.]